MIQVRKMNPKKSNLRKYGLCLLVSVTFQSCSDRIDIPPEIVDAVGYCEDYDPTYAETDSDLTIRLPIWETERERMLNCVRIQLCIELYFANESPPYALTLECIGFTQDELENLRLLN